MQSDRRGNHLYEGDIIDNVHLLISATHIFIFDTRVKDKTKTILLHLLRHLSGAKLRVVFSCSNLTEKHQSALSLRFRKLVKVTTGENDMTMYVFDVDRVSSSSSLGLTVFDDYRVGLRST